MIKQIIAMLQLDNFYGESELIDIAKGKHELTGSTKKIWRQQLRKKLYNGRDKKN
jgi:hypothetical protein